MNDNAPQFSADSYFFDLPEELPVGTIVFMKIKVKKWFFMNCLASLPMFAEFFLKICSILFLILRYIAYYDVDFHQISSIPCKNLNLQNLNPTFCLFFHSFFFHKIILRFLITQWIFLMIKRSSWIVQIIASNVGFKTYL